MNIYMKRLICILCKIFVVISRPRALDGEELATDGGIPQAGVRYWWRYWDNKRNVYQMIMGKFRDSAGTMSNISDASIKYRNLEEATMLYGMPPEDFKSGGGVNLWMCVAPITTSTGLKNIPTVQAFSIMLGHSSITAPQE